MNTNPHKLQGKSGSQSYNCQLRYLYRMAVGSAFQPAGEKWVQIYGERIRKT